jgi:uncharacterized cofD-like protein
MRKRTKKQNKIVVIGGGTGTSIMLRGLKNYPLALSAIVTTADTGGSSGKLRRETGMTPPGDIRQCLVALNENNHPFVVNFNARFKRGDLAGHAFGNLFLALLWQRMGDMQKVVDEAERILHATNHVIPVTLEPTNLVARLKNGKSVSTETKIIRVKQLGKKLKKLELLPRDATVNKRAKQAIRNADFIIIGPGNMYASLTPPLLVNGVAKTIARSKAKKIFVANLMNQPGLTDGFSVRDYLNHFAGRGIFGKDIFDYVVYNTGTIDKRRRAKLGVAGEPVIATEKDPRYIGAPLVAASAPAQDPIDNIHRTLIRHDSSKVAHVLYKRIIHGKETTHRR